VALSSVWDEPQAVDCAVDQVIHGGILIDRPGLVCGLFCRRITSNNRYSLRQKMLPVLSQTALPSTLLVDLDAARNYARQSLSAATRTAYASDWRVFEGWCIDRGVEALPASPASVAAFLAAMAERGLRPATIARRCAAVRHYHRLVGIDPLPTDAAIVKTTMKGLRRSLGAAQAKKAPISNVVAKRLVDAAPDVSLKGRRDRALLMVGFAGAFRKSEVVALNVEDLEFCDEGVRVTIRRSKADQEAKGQIIAVLRGAGPFCPVRLLREWLDAAGITEGALFRQVPKGGKCIGDRLGGRAYYEVIKQGIAGIELPRADQQTPEALAILQRAEIERWWPIIKSAGIKTQ
jgi:site-specific recombinase XerC